MFFVRAKNADIKRDFQKKQLLNNKNKSNENKVKLSES